MPLLKAILAGDNPLLFVLLGLFQGGLEARSLLRPTPASFLHRVEADVVVGEMSEPLDVGMGKCAPICGDGVARTTETGRGAPPSHSCVAISRFFFLLFLRAAACAHADGAVG